MYKTLTPYFLHYTKDKIHMDIETLKRMLIDFSIFPELISIVKIKLFFKQCANKEISNNNHYELFDIASLNDFMALCSLEIPFKEPQPTPVSKLIFLLQKISQSPGLKKVVLSMGLSTLSVKKESIDILANFKNHFPQYFENINDPNFVNLNFGGSYSKYKSQEESGLGILNKEGFHDLLQD
jgi:hypothetical protein